MRSDPMEGKRSCETATSGKYRLCPIPRTGSDETPEGRWRPYKYEEIVNRDKVSLDLSWLRDESLEDSANLPDPHILAQEIAEDLRSSLDEIESILADLQERAGAATEN